MLVKEIKIKQVMEWLLIATFFTPLLFTPALFIFPFIFPKILFFRSVTLILFGLYILLLMMDWGRYRIRFTSVTVAVLLFLFSFTVSTFAGVDWYRSLWDSHERMLGLFTFVHFILFYLVVTAIGVEDRVLRVCSRWFIFLGSAVMILGLLQKINPQLLLNNGSSRVSATLGNPIYYSGYGIFLAFFSLLRIKTEKKKSLWWWLALAGGVFGFLGIFLGGTRGSILGFFVGIIVFASLFAFLEGNKKTRVVVIGALLSLTVIIGVLFTNRNTSLVQSIPGVNRVVLTSLTSDTASTRVMAWQIAIEGWKEHPFIGWGPNNYYYAFNKYYNPAFLTFGFHETWFDNAHNVILNTLAVQGIFGVFSYLGIFVGAGIMIWKKRQGKEYEASVVIAFLVAHLVHNIFVFENPTSYLYFFFFLAYLNIIFSSFTLGKTEKKNITNGALWMVGLVVLFFVYFTNIQPAKANNKMITFVRGYAQNPSQTLGEYQKTQFTTPHIDDIHNDFARITLDIVIEGINRGKSDGFLPLVKMAYQDLELNRKIHPLDIRNELTMSQLGDQIARLSGDTTYIRLNEELLTRALSFSPKRQQVLFMLADTEMILGKNPEAIEHLTFAIEQEPRVVEAWFRLARVYALSGDSDEAKRVITEASAHGVLLSQVMIANLEQIQRERSASIKRK